MTNPPRLPLTARPRDLVYCIFFSTHIVATLLVDLQPLIPPAARVYLPDAYTSIIEWYVGWSGDPVLGGAFTTTGNPRLLWTWFKSFLVLEAVFQLPLFFYGLVGLYKDSRKIYPLLLVYGASAATTTLPCIATLLAAPSTLSLPPESASVSEELVPTLLSLTSNQRWFLLGTYAPYLLIPIALCFDMAFRIGALLARGVEAEAQSSKTEGARTVKEE